MRTFLVLLVLTNIAYFGWNQGWLRQLPAQTPRQVQRPAVLPASDFVAAPTRLALLAELDAGERQALGQRTADTADTADTAAAAAPAEAGLAAGVASLEPAAAPAAATSAPIPNVQPWCAALGPFEDSAAAQALIPQLQALDIAATLRTQAVPVATTYWVYMPPFATDGELQRMLAELKERQIDSYFMRSGQFAGGISLGVFSRRASAETTQADLARRGYQSQIGEVQRESTRSWLDLRAPDAALAAGPDWAAFRARTEAVTLAENVCESVASD
jgi:cell division protein FtsN